MEKKEYGLVLSGGGGKGAYQVGALQVLDEMGILPKIKAVSGSSVGCLNMALLAQNNMEQMVSVWDNIDYRDFVSPDELGFVPGQEGDGMFSREGLKRIIREKITLEYLASPAVRYFATVCRKNEAGETLLEYVYLNDQPRDKAELYLLATSAVPVLYDSVEINGNAYFDGGLKDNCPVLPVYNCGIRDIIVISLDYRFTLDTTQYPGANFYVLRPSTNLDLNTVSGTVDFSKEGAAYRKKLGYLDADASLRAQLTGGVIPDMSGHKVLAGQEMRMTGMEIKVQKDMEGLSRILGKYGVDLD
ncbi:MAG: patatin-like phospholipase family protein [Lachnospiraceae bacterium]|nr:patatin-like phospholipase family protein [Lachnospiraceae bacterium]